MHRSPFPKTAYLPLVAHGAALLLMTWASAWLFDGPGISNATLLRFDAIHYARIMENGYQDESSAFFPLFPLFWRALGVDAMGMALINAIIYLCTATALAKMFGMELRAVLMFAALPSVFFLFTPYSEALFFLGSGILLFAVHRRLNLLAAVALFFCSLTRPAFTALLPAILIMTLLSPEPLARRILRCIFLATSSVLGLITVMWLQFRETGDALGFYSAQSSYGNTFKLPRLPLTSWGGDTVVPLDASALLLGVICAVVLVTRAIHQMRGKTLSYEPEVILSLGYVAGISAIALLLRNGEMYSLNRFVFATPFALVLIHRLSQYPLKLSAGKWALFLMVPLAFFILFGSFVHIRTFLLYSAVGLHLVLGFIALTNKGTSMRTLFLLWLFFSLSVQFYFFNRYLSNEWVA
jgi:energy-converting hydrogenase Eha subunit A